MNVPTLRFKEFTDAWRETSLGNVSNGVMYGMNAAAIPYDGINKYIRITDIDDTSRAFIPSPLCSPDGEIEDKFKLKNGDLVFARTGASVGKSYLYKEKDGNLLFAGFLVKFSVVRANPYFVYSQTLTPSYKRWLTVMSMRSGQPGVNAEELKEFKFLTPQLPEQTKIANFLTAVDEKISLLTQKHDLLTQYKKGVMQQIFSQELRFKDDDGRDFPEWEEKELRTLCDLITKGTTPTSVGHEFKTSGINFIKIESLEADGKLIKEKLGFIDADAHAKLFRSQLKLYDLLFSIAGALGRVAIVTDEFLPANTNQALAIIRLSEGQSLDTKYVFYTLTNDRIKKLIESISVQLAQANLSLKDIGDFVIELPCIKEQTKIANFLTAIDDKITATQAQLHAVKQYKHGLLQQMFV